MNKKLILVFLYSVLLSMIGCDMKNSGGNSNFRTDVAPLEKRLLNLPKITSAKWKSQTFGSGEGITVPGSAAYRIWGYAKYNQDDLTRTMDKFKDTVKDDTFRPDFPFKGEENYVWKQSKELALVVKSKLIVGKVWVCTEQGLVYFDLEGE